MRVGIVPELLDERMTLERSLDDAALNPASAAVNEPHFSKPCLRGGGHILLDDRRNIRRRERVQVELALDWNRYGIHAAG